MPKNQLFKIIPDIQIVQTILECFGLENLEDTRLFTKEHMKDIQTVDKMTELSEILKDYYLPCKGKKYLINLTEKKCITLLRQFIKVHDYKCIGMEKSVNGNKTMSYRLLYSKENFLKNPQAKQNEEFIVSFE